MKKMVLIFVCLCLFATVLLSQEASSTTTTSFGQDLVQGLEAYRLGNWEDSVFFLKRTSSFQEASSDSVWYFVVMAEMNLGDYNAALRDGTMFLNFFPESSYIPEITFQTLYAGYELEMYDEAITGFSAFIQEYPNNNLTSSAIFFTGESLYNVYEFERSKSLFQRLVAEYPNSSKFDDAVFRLELLEQREREEKLLYLLRVTGEEAVAAKEDYERQIKQLQSEETIILRKRLQELEADNSRLQIENQELAIQNESLKNTVTELNSLEVQRIQTENDSNANLINDLTQKALELQKLIEAE